MSHAVYLWLGSNLWHPRQNILNAVRQLSYIGTIQKTSPLYRSKALWWKKQHDYINTTIEISTDLSPHDLLRRIKKIEKKLWRKKSYRRWPRIIDIDILLYDTISIQTPLLTIPHRHYLDRPFVFIPLHDIIDTQNIYYEHIDKAYQNYIHQSPLPNDNISLI